ncbi:hypothetical protein WSM22_20220 [Cytophagales bacterium WSM2-2]|nr:hypothetical protein WSM22_20220 [Cytophagales bacterium WSM2-2]
MKKHNRRKFLFAGLSLAALIATLRFTKKKDERKTMKFLTQDGRLVEIEEDKVPVNKRAASKEDIQNWVKKSKSI